MISGADQSATESPQGAQTMSPAMRDMSAYCEYLYRQIEPALGQSVWEVGLGHGNYTQLLLKSGKRVLATDVDPECLRLVGQQFRNVSQLTLAQVDLRDAASISQQTDFKADSIICLNVLEHIEHDIRALSLLRESVLASARLGLVVPAMPKLYGKMDREAGHFRRYSRDSLKNALQHSGWQIESLRYVNALGALGWWFHNCVRKNAGLQDAKVNQQMRAADGWLPRIASWTDPCFARLAGLSLVAIAINPGPLSKPQADSH